MPATKDPIIDDYLPYHKKDSEFVQGLPPTARVTVPEAASLTAGAVQRTSSATL